MRETVLPENDVFQVKRVLDDAGGGHPDTKHVLLGGHKGWQGDPVNVRQVAAKPEEELRLLEGKGLLTQQGPPHGHTGGLATIPLPMTSEETTAEAGLQAVEAPWLSWKDWDVERTADFPSPCLLPAAYTVHPRASILAGLMLSSVETLIEQKP